MPKGCRTTKRVVDDTVPMKPDWHKVTESEIPKDRRIMMTNGSDVLIGTLTKHCFEVEAVGGYEWEADFSHKAATHWAEAPELP